MEGGEAEAVTPSAFPRCVRWYQRVGKLPSQQQFSLSLKESGSLRDESICDLWGTWELRHGPERGGWDGEVKRNNSNSKNPSSREDTNKVLKKPNLDLIPERAFGTLELVAIVLSGHQLVGWEIEMKLPDFQPLFAHPYFLY